MHSHHLSTTYYKLINNCTVEIRSLNQKQDAVQLVSRKAYTYVISKEEKILSNRTVSREEVNLKKVRVALLSSSLVIIIAKRNIKHSFQYLSPEEYERETVNCRNKFKDGHCQQNTPCIKRKNQVKEERPNLFIFCISTLDVAVLWLF